MAQKIRIAVLGASGYTGADLVRLALNHPQVEIVALAANQKAGQTMADIWPHFAPYPALPRLIRADAVDWSQVDAVFGCLPHAASAELLSTLKDTRIIDLSADFRLLDAEVYGEWYGVTHPAPHLLADAVYGLTEMARPRLKDARLVACPGCYPTAALLALLPLAEAGLITPTNITINALSGVSGAGRGLKESNLFVEVAEAVAPYAVGRHRHMPEIEQGLADACGKDVRVRCASGAVPAGVVATCDLNLRQRSSPASRFPNRLPPAACGGGPRPPAASLAACHQLTGAVVLACGRGLRLPAESLAACHQLLFYTAPLRSFTPHLMPMTRGMESACYVKLANGATAADLRKHLQVGM